MKYSPNDIVLNVRLACDEGLESRDIQQILDLIENVLYHSDRRDVVYASQVFSLPDIQTDAAKERIREYRYERLRIREIETGSIVIEGAVATVALYVLKKTIGEPLGDAYKNSNIYADLTDLFRSIIDDKTLFISNIVRDVAAKRGYRAEVNHELKSPDAPRRVNVKLRRKDEERRTKVPTLGEELDKTPNE